MGKTKLKYYKSLADWCWDFDWNAYYYESGRYYDDMYERNVDTDAQAYEVYLEQIEKMGGDVEIAEQTMVYFGTE